MRVKKIETIKPENKAMNLRREELQKEDKKLLKPINKNIEIIEKFRSIKKCKKSK